MTTDTDMILSIRLNLENDAMQTPEEIARILRHLAKLYERHGFGVGDLPLHDINGNRVGYARQEID